MSDQGRACCQVCPDCDSRGANEYGETCPTCVTPGRPPSRTDHNAAMDWWDGLTAEAQVSVYAAAALGHKPDCDLPPLHAGNCSVPLTTPVGATS